MGGVSADWAIGYLFRRGDPDSSECLGGRPRTRLPSDLGASWVPEWLAARIANHITVAPDISTPREKQINFDTPTRFSGLTDLTTIAVAIVLTGRAGGGHLFPPTPNYLSADMSSDIDATDAIHIARICHIVGFGRLNGREKPCPKFALRLGPICGGRVGGFDALLPVGSIIRIRNQKHLRAPAISADYRRRAEHWGGLTDFATKAEIRFRGTGLLTGVRCKKWP